MRESFELTQPEHFTCGTVGEPGQRVFFIQARQGRRLVTLKSEKEQVRALGEYLAELLEKLPGGAAGTPPDPALVEPVEPAWPIGSIALGYDDATRRIEIVATAVAEDEEEEPPTAKFSVTREQAAGFAARDLPDVQPAEGPGRARVPPEQWSHRPLVTCRRSWPAARSR